jgi:hypothetical protein
MMIATRRQSLSIAVIVLFCACASVGQRTTETSVPLGDKLKKALEQSSLSGGHAAPFHSRVHLSESTNPTPPYRAEIEESGASPKQWSRVIETRDFKQTLIVTGDKSSEQIAGDYYPLWLIKGLCERPL